MRHTFYLKRTWGILMPAVCAFVVQARADMATNQPATEWIDPDTGHRVAQLSHEPGSQSLYFNLNAFTPDGQRMVITTPTGISAINLKTQAIEKIVDGSVRIIQVGQKDRAGFSITSGMEWFARPILTPKPLAKLPVLPPGGSISTVNADETLLAGTITGQNVPATNEETIDAGTNGSTAGSQAGKARKIQERLDQHLPMELFSLPQYPDRGNR